MTTLSVAELHGLELPPDRLKHLAERRGLAGRVCPSTAADFSPPPARTAVLLGPTWEDTVPAVWEPPFFAWIEVAALSDQAILDLLDHASNYDLYASFTTMTANRLMLAGAVTQVVNERWPLAGNGRDNLELALHEALCNALLHGNLQLDSMGSLSLDALDRFSNDLTRRMSDPLYGSRRVEVACSVCQDTIAVDVIDQGAGFSPRPASEGGASGRGLTLIAASCQSFELHDGGRCIRMRFSL